MANLGFRLTGIYSHVKDVYRLQNDLRPYSVYSIPITRPDAGPDGVIGTSDDTGQSLTYFDYASMYAGKAFEQGMFVNDPSGNESYKSFEIALSRRLAGGWQFMAWYSPPRLMIRLLPAPAEVRPWQ